MKYLCFRKIILFLIIASFLMTGLNIEAAEEGEKIPLIKVNPISLRDSVKLAIDNSFDVKIAKLDLLVAETDRMYAESVFDTIIFGEMNYTKDKRQQVSAFYPDDGQKNAYSFGISKKLPTGTEIRAEMGDTRNWANNALGLLRNPTHTAEIILEARQPIGKNFFGYIDRKNVTLSILAIKNADLSTKDNIESFMTNVLKAYWSLVYNKRTLKIYSDILKKAEALHEVNKKNYDIGMIEKGDFLASEANVITRRTDLIIAENDYKKTEENLKLLLNLNAGFILAPTDDFNANPVIFDLADCMEEAFDKRRDYFIAKRNVEMNNINLKMKNNARWPVIDIVGSFFANGIDRKMEKAVDGAMKFKDKAYYGGIEVSMPLENRSARSEYDKAKYEKQQSILSLKKIERSIITEVGNSLRDVVTYEAGLENMRVAVDLQTEKLKEEEKKFKFGRSTTKTLIDYQRDLLLAEMEEAVYLLKHEQSKVDLDRSMNIILEKCEAII